MAGGKSDARFLDAVGDTELEEDWRDCETREFEPELDQDTQAWLDYQTREFVECLSEEADRYRQWLADQCGSDDLFDLGGK